MQRRMEDAQSAIEVMETEASAGGGAVTVKVNGEEAVTYSPLTYCYRAQNSTDEKLANAVKALYKYYLAAKSYFPAV